MEETLGIYRVKAWKGTRKVASVKVVAWYRRGAYFEVMGKIPPHNKWDAVRISEAAPGQQVGIIPSKNDLKRKL